MMQGNLILPRSKCLSSPFDEIATECAVQLKEKGIATEVVAVTIGAEKSLDTLRVAMAMGADRGIHVVSEAIIQPIASCQNSSKDC